VPPNLLQASFDLLSDCGRLLFTPFGEEGRIKKGSVACRGYISRGGEPPHRNMDYKDGIYFGLEHPDDAIARVLLGQSP